MKKPSCLLLALLTALCSATCVFANSPPPIRRESYYAGVSGLEVTFESWNADGRIETQTCTLAFGGLVTIEGDSVLYFTAPDGSQICTDTFEIDLSDAFPAGEDVTPKALGAEVQTDAYGIVSDPEGAILRYGPSEPFESKLTLPEDLNLVVLASWGDWSYVGARYNHARRTGWIRTASFTEISGPIGKEEDDLQDLRDLMLAYLFPPYLTTVLICVFGAAALTAICIITIVLIRRAKKKNHPRF